MQVVVFGSGSGTNLEALLKAQRTSAKPLFEIKALFTDRACRFETLGASAGIPVIYHSFMQFLQKEGAADRQNLAARLKYDAEALQLLARYSEKYRFSIDLIVLAGYMRIITPPLLKPFENKIINVHPADLTLLSQDGTRRFVGMNSVYDALGQGYSCTRSSVIIVDEHIDAGPILVTGPQVPYEGGYPLTKELAEQHQAKQKILSDWPACISAVTLIAEGRLGIDLQKRVYLDKILQKNCGYEMTS